jgi:glycosyltransferase involved in cell wall biosynthesis
MTIPVSVVLPAYNRASTIIRAVDSVLKQSPSLFTVSEVLVIDDGSVDETASLVRQVTDPRVRLVQLEKNHGACFARNHGVSLAVNEFIAFQDSDDVWYEQKLSVLGRAYRPDCDVFFSAFYKLIDGRKELYPDWLKKSEYRAGELIRHSLVRNPLSTATLLIRKRIAQEAGGFDERLKRFQDWEFILRIFRFHPVAFVQQPLLTVEVLPDSISRRYCEGISSRSYILRKHAPLFMRHPFLSLRFLAGLAGRVAFAPFRPAARI